MPAVAAANATPIDRDIERILGVSIRHLDRSFFDRARPKIIRSMREWFEQEIVIPSGPCKGEPWRADRQPVQGLLLDLMDGGEFNEFVTVGPSQTGKSLLGYIGPVVYHSTEMRETVVLGLPAGGQVQDKWNDVSEILSASASLKNLIPTRGPGSKGGQIRDGVYLTNGSRLRLMTTGGKNTGRAGYTSRVVAVTEMADFSASTKTNNESDPFRQIQARQRSYDADRRRTYAEGTVTTEGQYPWAARVGAAVANIRMPCVHCGEFVMLDRENLRGFAEAVDEQDALEKTHLACPSCDGTIDDENRRLMVQRAVIVFEGQTIDRLGKIAGERPRSRRVWFRYNAAHNLLVKIGEVGVEEWKALQHPDNSRQRHEAERQLSQQLWALPIKPKMIIDHQDVDPEQTAARRYNTPRGVLPKGVKYLACGIDAGAWRLHLTTLAVTEDDQLLVVDHSVRPTDYKGQGNGLDESTAVALALRELRQELLEGYIEADTGRLVVPDRILVDNSWETETIRSWCADTPVEHRERVILARGKGSNIKGERYRCPAKYGPNTIEIAGDQSYWVALVGHDVLVPEVSLNADLYKTRVQAAVTASLDSPGAMLFYRAPAKEHVSFCRHLFAEKLAVDTSRGDEAAQMIETGKANHHLDSTSYAMVGLSLAGWDYVAVQAAAIEHAAAAKALASTKEDGAMSETEQDFIRDRSTPPAVPVALRPAAPADDIVDLSSWGDSPGGGYDSDDPHSHLF